MPSEGEGVGFRRVGGGGMSVHFTVVFRWKYVPFGQEQADYCGSMGEFKKLALARQAAEMLKGLLGNDWKVWINENREEVKTVEEVE